MASDLPNQDSSCSDNSDNEIFVGKISMKEIKRRFLDRQTIACPYTQDNKENEISVRIIETNSEPDLKSNISCNTETFVTEKTDSNDYSQGYHSEIHDSANASFIEHVIDKMQYLPKQSKNNIDQVNHCYENGNITGMSCETVPKSNNPIFSDISLQKNSLVMNAETLQKTVSYHQQTPTCKTPSILMDANTSVDEETHFKTPLEQIEAKMDKQPLQTLKYPIQRNLFNSVSELSNCTSLNSATHQNKTSDHSVFKTPAKLPINKKNLVNSSKKTPKKLNNYEHIASPIAAYIKNSPQVPLLKDVKPKKQLVPVSGIPKFKDTLYSFKQHKENVNLPEIAYRSAKKTKVIDNQEEPRMPQSSTVKKLLSSLPRPVVIKHDHRENTTNTKPLREPEDSFADLSLHQADLSVCIKKSAMSPTPYKLKK